MYVCVVIAYSFPFFVPTTISLKKSAFISPTAIDAFIGAPRL